MSLIGLLMATEKQILSGHLHEASSVAPEKPLACATFLGENHPSAQFIKMPISQSRWYQMHTIKEDTPHRPDKSVFSWRNTEAKVSSQFLHITKAAAYPPTGPVSRPITHEYLRRWEKSAKEGSYIVNQATGFNRCASKLQDRNGQSFTFLQSSFSKGKAPKEVTDAVRYEGLPSLPSECVNCNAHVSSARSR